MLRAFVTAWRFAASPTNRSPVLVNATTDGVVRLPSEFSSTTGSPPSMTAMQEFVVPKSMPKTFAIKPRRSCHWNLQHCRCHEFELILNSLWTNWLHKKYDLNPSRKNSDNRATLSQRCPFWHRGNVTNRIYRRTPFLTGRIWISAGEKACSVRRMCLESPDKFLAATGRLGKASVPQFKQNN